MQPTRQLESSSVNQNQQPSSSANHTSSVSNAGEALAPSTALAQVQPLSSNVASGIKHKANDSVELRDIPAIRRLLPTNKSLQPFINGELDMNERNEDGDTIVHVLTRVGAFPALEKVVRLGADLFALDAKGNSVVHLAIAMKKNALLPFFAAKALDLSLSNNVGWTPAYNAAIAGNVQALRLLGESKANLNGRSNLDIWPPIHAAVFKGFTEAVKTLVGYGVSVDQPNSMGLTPVAVAIQEGNLDMMETLIELGADLNQFVQSLPLLHFAAQSDHVDTINYLVMNHNVDVNLRNTDGSTAVHVAVMSNNSDALAHLHYLGADLEAVNHNGQTPMNIAVALGYDEIREELNALGVDEDQEEQNTHTASVNQSSTKIAKDLRAKYENVNTDEIFMEIGTWVKNLPVEGSALEQEYPNDAWKNQAAKNLFNEFEHLDYVDSKSAVNLKTFLALSWVALQDSAERLPECPEENAKEALRDAFYEMQRGYNLGDRQNPLDDGEADEPICAAGAFNKVAEKLVGVLRSAALVFVTKQSFTNRLRHEIQQALETYLASNPDSLTVPIKETLAENGGLLNATTWNLIKDDVSERVMNAYDPEIEINGKSVSQLFVEETNFDQTLCYLSVRF